MGQLIANFGIDWRLLTAQIINFFILLYVLKRFAYKPFIGLLDARREEIEKGHRFAKDAEEKLRTVDEVREFTLENAKKEALKIVSEGENSAEKKKAEILLAAEQQVVKIVDQGKRIIKEEKQKAEDQILRETKELMADAIKKITKKSPEKADYELIGSVLKELREVS